MRNDEIKTGNIGVITTKGRALYEVTGIRKGLLYCLPLEGPKVVSVCLPSDFWALLDYMP